MVKGYKLDGRETNGDKPVENGLKMKEFGVFWLKLKGLSCLTQTEIINNSHAQSTPEKEGVVSAKKTFCAKRMTKAPNYISVFSTLKKASLGTSTLPMSFIFFLPSFCFSSSLRLRVMSPP